MVRIIKNTVVASRALTNSLSDKLLDHDDRRLVRQPSGFESVEHRLGKDRRERSFFVNSAGQGRRLRHGSHCAELMAAHSAGVSSGRTGADASRRVSDSGRAWKSRTGTPYMSRIGRSTVTLSFASSEFFAVCLTPEQAVPNPSRARRAVMTLAFIFLLSFCRIRSQIYAIFRIFGPTPQKTSQKVLTFNSFYLTLPDKSIILLL